MLQYMSQEIIVHIFGYVQLIDLDRFMCVQKMFLSIISTQSAIVSRRNRYLENLKKVYSYMIVRHNDIFIGRTHVHQYGVINNKLKKLINCERMFLFPIDAIFQKIGDNI